MQPNDLTFAKVRDSIQDSADKATLKSANLFKLVARLERIQKLYWDLRSQLTQPVDESERFHLEQWFDGLLIHFQLKREAIERKNEGAAK